MVYEAFLRLSHWFKSIPGRPGSKVILWSLFTRLSEMSQCLETNKYLLQGALLVPFFNFLSPACLSLKLTEYIFHTISKQLLNLHPHIFMYNQQHIQSLQYPQLLDLQAQKNYFSVHMLSAIKSRFLLICCQLFAIVQQTCNSQSEYTLTDTCTIHWSPKSCGIIYLL